MFFFTYTAAILSIISLSYAAFLFFRKRDDLLASYLAYIILGVAIWVGSNAMADVAGTRLTLIFWSGMALIGPALFCGFYLVFVHGFIHRKRPGRWHLAAYFLPAVIIISGAFSKYSVVETIFPQSGPTQIIPGVLYTVTFVYLLGSLLLGSIWMALFSYKKATPQQRLQIRYMEMGFLILFAATVIFGYILPLAGELRFFNVGPQFSIFLIGLSSYAILKHQLLDIKVVVQKGLIYTALLSLVVLFYLGVLYSTLFFSDIFTTITYLTASILTTFAGIFGIPPIKRYFQRVTDHIFFKDRYSYSEAIGELSAVLNHNLDIEELKNRVSDSLRNVFKAESIGIFFLQDALGMKAPDDEGPEESDRDRCETIDEIESRVPGDLKTELLSCDAYESRFTGPRIKEMLRSAEIIIPIVHRSEIIALFGLGKKRSGDPYFQDDINILKAFSQQCAVAIVKSELYEQMKEHSEHLEKKVSARTAEIEHLQKEQARIMLEISHNLQTPLTVIKGQLTGIKKTSLSKKELNSFEKSVDRISEFTHRLLKLASLTSIEDDKKEQVNLSAVLEDIISYFAVLAEQQDISIDSSIEEGICIHGNRKQLEELILNILSNAAKYIANQRKITIRLREEQDSVQFIVQDTGKGIPQKEIGKLFQSFYRSSNAKNIVGSGLGLAICKKIVDLHGGDIRIESEEGKGTQVIVAFPVHHGPINGRDSTL